jgi:hypothetical protein
MLLKRLIQTHREREERHRALVAHLQQAYEQSERLRAELSPVEHEIYELWACDLPLHRKRILEEVLRIRCRRVQDEMLALQAEILHAGHDLRRGAGPREDT